jgi:hypothetical protein
MLVLADAGATHAFSLPGRCNADHQLGRAIRFFSVLEPPFGLDWREIGLQSFRFLGISR